jgi:hypothetical protein
MGRGGGFWAELDLDCFPVPGLGFLPLFLSPLFFFKLHSN